MEHLNNRQEAAVKCVEGPLLLFAGAGSGKTRVITYRIAYLMKEMGIDPFRILAITFTNKAAGEMRERVDNIAGFGAQSVWVSTFHSLCVRILRRYIDALDFQNNFTIYDTDDQKNVIKACLKKLDIDSKLYNERMLMSTISKAKDQYISPTAYDRQAQGDFRKMQIARIYAEYQKQLRESNALDFDDLIYKTVELFEMHPDILDSYQERFRYIMVDEYQDTNHIQFLLVKQLAAKYRNICVVGDDDQSIYKFRGANIYNILNFEKEYPNATVIKLEQNYRSTGNILKAANGVIRNNVGRTDKALWTKKEDGEKIFYQQYDSEYYEADGIIHKIANMHREGKSYNSFAVLYRTNAQSRIFEEKLVLENIPHKIVGALGFYGRKEIKDLICYLKVIDNGRDQLALRRIINVPRRGIGIASIDKIQDYADGMEIGLLEAMFEVQAVSGLGKTANKVEDFIGFISDMRDMIKRGTFISEVFGEILERTGYWEALVSEHTEEAEGRMENILELKNKIIQYEEEKETPNLSELLEEIALVAEVDSLDESDDKVMLMTLHSAKGLEFPYVFLGGMEDGLFPSAMAINSEEEDAVEEERRLCYVGITRAKEKLYLSSAKQRMVRGTTNYSSVSRFIKEIPEEIIEFEGRGLRVTKEKILEQPSVFFDTSSQRPMTVKRKSVTVSSKPYTMNKEFGNQDTEDVGYAVGDTVRHIKFGKGVVIAMVSGGRDYEVTVDFEKAGVKKMFSSFAKLKKV